MLLIGSLGELIVNRWFVFCKAERRKESKYEIVYIEFKLTIVSEYIYIYIVCQVNK